MKPIIFNSEMMKAILDGRKTQTRRVIKTKIPIHDGWKFMRCVDSTARNRKGKCIFATRDGVNIEGENSTEFFHAPYKPGDRLWVRETWAMSGLNRAEYKASPADGKDFRCVSKWKPSIHMPRWASRITLEITDVRVERVQDITFGDIIKEGYEGNLLYECGYKWFKDLFISIHGKDAWERNDWVWVLAFKRVE